MTRLPRILVAIVLAVAAPALAACGGDDGAAVSERPEKVVLIPNGTAERATNGEWIGDIIPTEIRIKVGTTLVVKNEDVQPIEWGPYTLSPGQSLRQNFDRPGTYRNDCEVIAKLQVTLVVEP
jgi:hypothetical protein